jgi:hypothetical protein
MATARSSLSPFCVHWLYENKRTNLARLLRNSVYSLLAAQLFHSGNSSFLPTRLTPPTQSSNRLVISVFRPALQFPLETASINLHCLARHFALNRPSETRLLIRIKIVGDARRPLSIEASKGSPGSIPGSATYLFSIASRPVLGPTRRLPIQWALGVFPWEQSGRSVKFASTYSWGKE